MKYVVVVVIVVVICVCTYVLCSIKDRVIQPYIELESSKEEIEAG